MRALGSSIILLLALASNASAFCIAGMGTSCPIGASDVERILRPRIDGKPYGTYALMLEVEQYSVTFGRGQEHQADAIIQSVRNRVLPFMQGRESCGNIMNVVPNEFGRTAEWIASVIKNCERSRAFSQRNLATLSMLDTTSFGTRVAKIVLVLTDEGIKKVKSARVDRGQPGPLTWLAQAGGIQAHVATGNIRFQKFLRSSELPMAGRNVSQVEFAYEVIPNEWAHIEKALALDSLKPQVRIGSATFQKWSDGWRLADGPRL